MKFIQVFCVFVVLKIIHTQLNTIKGFEAQIVLNFVGDLVRDATAGNLQQVFDVALLEMVLEPKSELFNQIAIEISPAVVLTVDCSRTPEVINSFSMIIVVTDHTDTVKIFYCILFSHL